MKSIVINPLFLVLAFFLLQGCIQDDADITVTYNKGTAIYGDMETVRQTDLLAPPTSLINPGKIFVATDFLLIGEENKGIHVLDNQDPNSPFHVAFINIPGNKEYFFKDGFLYAESYYDMLKIDMSNPMNPSLVNRLQNAIMDEIKNSNGQSLLGFEFENITEKLNKNDNVYNQLNAGDGSYVYYDYANNFIPPSAVPASFAGNSSGKIGSVNRVIADKGYVYIISRSNLIIINDSNFENVYHGSIGWEMETIFPMNQYLFVGAQSEMTIFDVTDPSNPERVSSFWHATSCDPVYPTENGVAYVTLRTGDFAECPGDVNALIVLDIDDPQQPVELQEFVMKSPYGITHIGEKLFVGEGENGFKVFDATNPKSLVLEETITNIAAYDVLSHPDRADLLLIAGPNGLSQYKIAESYEHLSTVAY